jgi:hypothetical protein
VLGVDADPYLVVRIGQLEQGGQFLERCPDRSPGAGRVLDQDRAGGPFRPVACRLPCRALSRDGVDGSLERHEQSVGHLAGDGVESLAEVTADVHDEPRRAHALRSAEVGGQRDPRPLSMVGILRREVDEVGSMTVRRDDRAVGCLGFAVASERVSCVA